MRLLAFIFIIIAAFNSFGQEQLDEAKFKELILDNGWSAEDSAQIKMYEIMLLFISSDTCSIVYVNWMEGIWQNACDYILKIENDFFELEIKSCLNGGSIKFIYGYLSAPSSLRILLTENRYALNQDLFQTEDWIDFTKLQL